MMKFDLLYIFLFVENQIKKCPARPPQALTLLSGHRSQTQLILIPSIFCAQDITELCGIRKNSTGMTQSEVPELNFQKRKFVHKIGVHEDHFRPNSCLWGILPF